jgi:hypothetical protein
MTIAFNPASQNSHFSICDNFDPDSNLSEESDPHEQKQPSPKISRDAGRTISINPV